MRVGHRKLGVIVAFAIAIAPSVAAQDNPPKVKPSQRGGVSQRIADTTITLDYSRPVARGRELFGKLVPYGRIWCPGADDATTIEVSTKVTFESQELPAGKYSVWAEPGPDKWTVIFNKQANVFHTRYPAGQDAIRMEITPRTGSHMETLAFYFPVVDGHKGELALHWGTVVVPMKLEVP
jgi:Protein of unknown function (DUF2911)